MSSLIDISVNSVTNNYSSSAEVPIIIDLSSQLSQYANLYIASYRNFSEDLQKMVNDQTKVQSRQTLMNNKSRRGRRRRRQMVTPDLAALQGGYSKFFGAESKKSYNTKKKKVQYEEDNMPIVLVPGDNQAECVSNNQLSSFGFLGFVLNVVNAVVNVANNINNNLNSNNDNNNNNNQNDVNANMAGVTNTLMNNNPPVILPIGRRLQRLKEMKKEVERHINNIRRYQKKRKRREVVNSDEATTLLNLELNSEDLSVDTSYSPSAVESSIKSSGIRAGPIVSSGVDFSRTASTDVYSRTPAQVVAAEAATSPTKAGTTNTFHGISSDPSCMSPDAVDEALLAAVALLDMWREVLFEEDPHCLALEFCHTAGKLTQISRLSGMMAQVAGVAAANMLLNFQGVNPAFLISATEAGAEGGNCTDLFQECADDEEMDD